MKKTLSLIIVMLICFTSTCTVFASSNNLNMQNKLENSNEYKALSPEQQEQLKAILADDQLWKNELLPQLLSNEKISSSNKVNDVVISSSMSESRVAKKDDEETITATANYSRSVEIFGVTLVAIKGYVTYDYIKGSKIVDVQDANIYESVNWHPTLTLDVSSPTGTVKTKTKAYGQASVTMGIGWDQLDVDFSSGVFKVWGDYNGNEGGSFVED